MDHQKIKFSAGELGIEPIAQRVISLTPSDFKSNNIKGFNEVCARIFYEIFNYFKNNISQQKYCPLNFDQIEELSASPLMELIYENNAMEKRELPEDIDQLIRFYTNNLPFFSNEVDKFVFNYDKVIGAIMISDMNEPKLLKNFEDDINSANLHIIYNIFPKVVYVLNEKTIKEFFKIDLPEEFKFILYNSYKEYLKNLEIFVEFFNQAQIGMFLEDIAQQEENIVKEIGEGGENIDQ